VASSYLFFNIIISLRYRDIHFWSPEMSIYTANPNRKSPRNDRDGVPNEPISKETTAQALQGKREGRKLTGEQDAKSSCLPKRCKRLLCCCGIGVTTDDSKIKHLTHQDRQSSVLERSFTLVKRATTFLSDKFTHSSK
jgi:hypothetical protein